MTRRFWIALALSVPVVALEMGGHLVDLHALCRQTASNWIQLALATPVVLWAGWPFFERGCASLRTRNLNMFTLIAMGVGVAFAYSVVATFAPGVFPPAFRNAERRGRGLFRGGGGRSPCSCCSDRCSSSARANRPAARSARFSILRRKLRAAIRADGADEEVALDAISGRGSLARAARREGAGRRRSLLEGRGAVDESMVTGESMPVVKSAGDKVIGGDDQPARGAS